MTNTYLEEAKPYLPKQGDRWSWRGIDGYTKRRALVQKYAWAIPDESALSAISKCKKIVEIGAGTGYWAALLQARGVSIMPFDQHVDDNPYGHKVQWTTIYNGNHEVLRRFCPSFALMLCWPPYDDSMAYDCLMAYQGKTVIYIGEGEYGCTATDEFHEKLDRKWNREESISIPQWDGIRDYVQIYKR